LYKMRFTFICLLIISVCCFDVYARHGSALTKQDDSAQSAKIKAENIKAADSISFERAKRQRFIEDSIAMFYLKPNPKYAGQFQGKLFNDSIFAISYLIQSHEKPKANLRSGQIRKSRDPWIIEVILGLLLYTALLNLFFSKEIKNVMRSFYNKQAFAQADREGGLINSWASVGLFLLFNLTFGLILSEISGDRKIYYNISGFNLFITLSVVIGLLFALKFIVLKFIGFIFDRDRLVSEYIGIINLTYFNITFLLLWFVVCYSLLDTRFIPLLQDSTLVFVAIIFFWQYLRNSVNVISNFRFHKFYLFIYLCALEICPILILIKALNI